MILANDDAQPNSWGRFTKSASATLLAAMEEDFQLAQDEIEGKDTRSRKRRRLKARAHWELVRRHVRELGADRWRRIIDRDALDALRQQRELERQRAARLAAQEAARIAWMRISLALEEREAEIQEANEILWRAAVERAAIEAERKAAAERAERQAAAERAQQAHIAMMRTAARAAQWVARAKKVEAQKESAERLLAVKTRRVPRKADSWPSSGGLADYVTWHAWPASPPMQRSKMPSDNFLEPSSVRAAFVDEAAVRPKTPVLQPLQTSPSRK